MTPELCDFVSLGNTISLNTQWLHLSDSDKFCPWRGDALETNLVGTDSIIMMFMTWTKQYFYMIIGTNLIETSSTDTSDVRLKDCPNVRLLNFENLQKNFLSALSTEFEEQKDSDAQI